MRTIHQMTKKYSVYTKTHFLSWLVGNVCRTRVFEFKRRLRRWDQHKSTYNADATWDNVVKQRDYTYTSLNIDMP